MADCPTPHKRAYNSKRAARRARSGWATRGNRMRVYQCTSGHWHLTSRWQTDPLDRLRRLFGMRTW